ncbi:DUF4493 domain-containing protein [Mangrovibacterium lignilyticum]|uniref:DUF4493 domain-containing protein n=1 Tax=Mangrovibacterium lignilyticum TaxID=2668052 RepID=UPI0013D882BB|nr:DUF4493 domain-containing protein [Mangrovibacterium lignilyticum]
MKTFKLTCICLACVIVFCACRHDESLSETGRLILETSMNSQVVEMGSDLKAATITTPVDEFWIFLYCNDILQDNYPMQYGNLAPEIELKVGTYTILALSMLPENVVLPNRDATKGLYYSGETTVEIVAEETTQAEVVATQAVASVTVQFSDKFKQAFPTYSANVSGIVFDESNTAIAFFEAGSKLQVELTYLDNGEEKTRSFETSQAVAAGDDWTLSFDATGDLVLNGNGAITITVSTATTSQTENWNIEIGGSSDDPATPAEGDGTLENPYSVAQAQTIQDDITTAWVQGYIVGNIRSSTSVTTNWEEAGDTNIAIADQSGETDVNKMLFVQFDSSGSARTTLGLYSTEGSSLGMLVKFNGRLGTYFGWYGLNGVNLDSEYVIIE